MALGPGQVLEGIKRTPEDVEGEALVEDGFRVGGVGLRRCLELLERLLALALLEVGDPLPDQHAGLRRSGPDPRGGDHGGKEEQHEPPSKCGHARAP